MKISQLINKQKDPENPVAKEDLNLLSIEVKDDAEGNERTFLTLYGENGDYHTCIADMLDSRFLDPDFMTGYGYYEAIRALIKNGMTFGPGMRQKRTALYAFSKYKNAPTESLREIVYAGHPLITLEQCEKICAFIMQQFKEVSEFSSFFDVPEDYAEDFIKKCIMHDQK